MILRGIYILSAYIYIHALKMVMLNINTASFVELTSLPGVGKNMAQQIIDRRGDAQGCLTLDSFDDKPSLQARLKGFLEDGLLSFVPNHVSSGGMGEVGLTSDPSSSVSEIARVMKDMKGLMGSFQSALESTEQKIEHFHREQEEFIRQTERRQNDFQRMQEESRRNQEANLRDVLDGFSRRLDGGRALPEDGSRDSSRGSSRRLDGGRELAEDIREVSHDPQVNGIDIPITSTQDPMIQRILETIEQRTATSVPASSTSVSSCTTSIVTSGVPQFCGGSSSFGSRIRAPWSQPPFGSSNDRIQQNSPLFSGSTAQIPQTSAHRNSPLFSGSNAWAQVPQTSMDRHPAASWSQGSGGRSYVKISSYDGSSDFNAYIVKLETIAFHHGWDEAVMLMKLVESLTGRALDCFAWQKPEVRQSYALLRQQLVKSFGVVVDPISQRTELSTISQRVDETLEQFGQRVREVATKAYRSVPSDVFDMLSREAFFKGCTNKTAARLAMLKDPVTLNDAINVTRNMVFADKMLGCKPGQTRVSFRSPVAEGADNNATVPAAVRQLGLKGEEDPGLGQAIRDLQKQVAELCSKMTVSESNFIFLRVPGHLVPVVEAQAGMMVVFLAGLKIISDGIAQKRKEQLKDQGLVHHRRDAYHLPVL